MYPIRRFFPFTVATMSALILSAALTLLPARRVQAEVTFTSLYTFGADPSADGQPHGNLVQGVDGNFYGVTNHTIFRLTPAGTFTTFYRFDVDSSVFLRAPLVPTKDGSFYGTTDGGGSGTIFRLAADGALTTLHAFTGADGASPSTGLLLGADGNFYGSTMSGGAHNAGALFRVTPDGMYTLIYSFDPATGSSPYGPLVRTADGSLYGAASYSGTNYDGIIFRLAADGTFTTLHAFNGTDGRSPGGGLIQGEDGNFYGTTVAGGSAGDGTVFRLTPDGTLTTLHDFNGADGGEPIDLIPAGNGEFYGTTAAGGPNLGNFGGGYGTVYKLGADGTFITLRDFNGYEGNDPEGLVRASDGTLYGTTTGEDPDGSPDTLTGSVFKLVTDQTPVLPVVTTAVASYTPHGVYDGETDILLTLSSTLARPLKVRYTVKGSARPGVDYQALSGVVKFKKLQNTELIRVVATAAGQDSDTSPVVKIKLQPGSGYTLGPRTLKIHLVPED